MPFLSVPLLSHPPASTCQPYARANFDDLQALFVAFSVALKILAIFKGSPHFQFAKLPLAA